MNNNLFLSVQPDDPNLVEEKAMSVPEWDTYFTNATRCPHLSAPPVQDAKKGDSDSNSGTEYDGIPKWSLSVDPVLQWWQQYGSNIPHMQRLARRYLAVPATSAEPERVWSAASRICTRFRGRLSEDSIEKQLFLHRNIDLLPLPYQ